jgi:hypothetical protein
MATIYDAENNGPFATKLELLNTVNAVSGKPSVNVMHGVECDPDETPQRVLYTDRTTVASAGSNGPSWYTLGVFVVGTAGSQVPSPGFDCGELWVTYDISLLKPKLASVTPSLKDWNVEEFRAWIAARAKAYALAEHRSVTLRDLIETPALRAEYYAVCEDEEKERKERDGESDDPPPVFHLEEGGEPLDQAVLVRSPSVMIPRTSGLPNRLDPAALHKWRKG